MDGDRKIRVLHLGNPTGMYGAERWILALIRYLPRDSVESIVGVVEDRPGAAEAELLGFSAALGFETVSFEARGRINWSAVTQLRRFIRSHRIDVLHTHGYKTDIIGVLATRGSSCRLVSTPHGWTVKADMKLKVYETLNRFAFLLMDAVVPLSPRLHGDLGRWLGWRGNLHLIRNGVDIAEIDDAPESAESAAATAAANPFVVGYIGRLVAGKGVTDLVRAFGALDAPGKELWLVGDGPERQAIEKLTDALPDPARVRLLGYREDRLSLLKRFDVFVLPSYSEGIPRCLLEAMAGRVPVIASDIAGCRALVEHEATGLLFEPGNTGALAAALQSIFGDSTLRASLAAAARRFVLEHYSAQILADNYLGLYRGLLEPGSATGVDSLVAGQGDG